MKRVFSVIFALCAIVLCTDAQHVAVYSLNGSNFYAELISHNDTAIIVKHEQSQQQFTLTPDKILRINFNNGDAYIPENGVFVLHTVKEAREKAKQAELARMGNPNYAIGKAMKSTGGLCLGLGLPSAIVGAILVGVGSKEVTVNEKMSADELKDAADKAKVRGNCKTAGCVLLPFGASLTIVGIPLSVKGKKIMEMNVNYTGNGAGLAFAW